MIVFLTALIPRFILAFSSKEIPKYDAQGYDEWAVSIPKDGLFGAVRIIQSILGTLTCIIIYFIALELTDRNIAIVAGLIGATNLSFIKSTEHLLTELFSTFLITLLILSLIKLKHEPNLTKRITVGFLVGLIALTRSEMVFLLPFVYGVWLFLVFLKKYSLRLFLRDKLVTLTIFLIIVSLGTYRNWRVHHVFVPITIAMGINLYSSYCPPQGKLFGFTADDDIVKSSRKLSTELEKTKFFIKETFKFIRSNVNKLPRLEFVKFAFF